MTQHLRWTKSQLEDYLKKKNGGSIPAEHPLMAEIKKTNILQDIMSNKNINPWDNLKSNGQPISTQNQVSITSSRAAEKSNLRQDTGGAEFRENFFKKNTEEADLSKKINTKKVAIEGRNRAIESMRSADFSCSFESQKFLELTFRGVNLLSVNRLYSLSHFQRVKYRKMWHELIERAIEGLLGPAIGRNNFIPFSTYTIRSHHVSKRLCDTDSKSGFLKYPIDGLRYSGVIVDDTQAHFKDLFCTQSKGIPALHIRIDAVDEHYVPVGFRDPWVQEVMNTKSAHSPC